jgi:hypothetical protein
MEVSAYVCGSVSNSSNSADRYWDNSHSDPEPSGTETSDADEYYAEYLTWYWGLYDDTYEVEEGIALFKANGGVHGRCIAEVHCDVESDQSGSALSGNASYIYGYCNFEMTSN